ncbi:hypothetical protein [Marinibactrum halimedae]|uniref:Lipoprotein n=1 Tax=Marinibactrum halimedae TaxID=1444977 RepID=A0AA37T201_9GAMM|nr:hypothetical protein [Marinibactrum halimedae]MCD9457838.1 hypothetical protein [Marinibactrum halimedae]GLS24788.1 hypothetical protein GCM10007877_05020 [Marinibactrum halimedae]
MKAKLLASSIFLSIVVSACGGGGGGGSSSGSSTPTPAVNNDGPADVASNDGLSEETISGGMTETNEAEDNIPSEADNSSETAESIEEDSLVENEISNESDEAEVDYTPNEDLMISDADNSSELYVENTFSFSASTLVDIQITGNYTNGDAIANSLVRVYKVDDSVEELTEESAYEKSLLLVGMTDSSGALNQLVEWPNNLKKVIVEIEAVGVENEALLSVDDAIVHHFH